MKTIFDYMIDLFNKYGSYYAVAKKLEITQASVSIIRKTGRVSDETAVKIADLLDVDKTEVLLAAAMARSEGEVLKAWQRIYKAIGVAASFLLVIQSVSPTLKAVSDAFCILC